MAPIRVGAKAIILHEDRVLLVKYRDGENGHYNFPGGGIKRGESIRKGLRREVAEETNLDVKIGRLLLVGEYDPKKHKRKFGRLHKLTLYFLCTIRDEAQPSLPEKPDRNQIGVEWFSIDKLPATLLPNHHDLIVAAVLDEETQSLFTTRR
ncbi:MAG TPA: NUDIX domain-containing protein [Anaerolineales bacterium]|nr:NUDIX domain-containing protein [Anaerolineales bacterium]